MDAGIQPNEKRGRRSPLKENTRSVTNRHQLASQRSAALEEAIAFAQDITFIFTDSRSSVELDSSAAREYEASAKERGCPFISIILSCRLEENTRRLCSVGRGGSRNTKLTDLEVFRTVRETEDIYHFGGPMELELDVTESSAIATAEKVHAFTRECLSSRKDSIIT